MRSPQPLRRALAALVVALVLPLPALAGPQHVVKSGETLSEIAERYGVSVKRLLQLNGIKDPNLVEAGTRLKLPEGSPAQGQPHRERRRNALRDRRALWAFGSEADGAQWPQGR